VSGEINVAEAKRQAAPPAKKAKTLADAIEAAKRIEEIARQFHALALECLQIGAEPRGVFLDGLAVSNEIERVKAILRASVPFGVCPYCQGSGCKPCHNQGWVPKSIFHAAPQDLQAKVEAKR
jgi:hypothetical protein